MFYTLHRLVKFLVFLLIAGVFVFVWRHRSAAEPLLVWYEVYDNGGLGKTAKLPLIQGRGHYVLGGSTFQMKTPEGAYYTVTLAGLETATPEKQWLENQRMERLRSMVLSNVVHVNVTYHSSGYNVLGIVHVHQTNLNLNFITNGLASLNSDYIKRMPRDIQYNFFAARRTYEKRREQASAALALQP